MSGWKPTISLIHPPTIKRTKMVNMSWTSRNYLSLLLYLSQIFSQSHDSDQWLKLILRFKVVRTLASRGVFHSPSFLLFCPLNKDKVENNDQITQSTSRTLKLLEEAEILLICSSLAFDFLPLFCRLTDFLDAIEPLASQQNGSSSSFEKAVQLLEVLQDVLASPEVRNLLGKFWK